MFEQTSRWLLTTMARITNEFCTYKLEAYLKENGPPELVYIGMCKLSDHMRMPDLSKNAEFFTIVKPDMGICLEIVATGTQVEMYNYWAQLKAKTVPIPRCNSPHNNMARGLRSKILCVETGMVFDTAKSCSFQMGLTYSHLMGHLNGQFPHVKGLTFKRVMG